MRLGVTIVPWKLTCRRLALDFYHVILPNLMRSIHSWSSKAGGEETMVSLQLKCQKCAVSVDVFDLSSTAAPFSLFKEPNLEIPPIPLFFDLAITNHVLPVILCLSL